MSFCAIELDPEPVTLVLIFDLDMVKMHQYTQMTFLAPVVQKVPPKKLSFRFRISLSDMTNYKSADF